MKITHQEAEQYIRLTLRQHNMTHIPVLWTNTKRRLGCYRIEEKRIELSNQILQNFHLFSEVFLHELAHALDIDERTKFFGTHKKNGRNDFHGKNWKKWCSNLNIHARRFIPVN
jgi:predicted SprT family Zn-dependent metalloprotease